MNAFSCCKIKRNFKILLFSPFTLLLLLLLQCSIEGPRHYSYLMLKISFFFLFFFFCKHLNIVINKLGQYLESEYEISDTWCGTWVLNKNLISAKLTFCRQNSILFANFLDHTVKHLFFVLSFNQLHSNHYSYRK